MKNGAAKKRGRGLCSVTALYIKSGLLACHVLHNLRNSPVVAKLTFVPLMESQTSHNEGTHILEVRYLALLL